MGRHNSSPYSSRMKQLLRRGLVLAGSMAMLVSPFASHAATTNAFSPGALIKGSGSAVYYFASNGKRYVFTNDKAYFTWYKDFSGVIQIPDRTLSAIPLGGNVTYRPGVKMLKITSDPRTYAVDQGGVLRWITTAQIAETLYGLSWKNQIDDLADAFFINYKVGNPIQQSAEFTPANVKTNTTTISQDKQMDETNVTITISDTQTGYVPATITVKAGTTITWTNRDTSEHTVTFSGFDSGSIAPGANFVHKFSSAGSFEYHDAGHTSITGTVNVIN